MERTSICLFVFGLSVRAVASLFQVSYGIHPTSLPMLDLWNDFHGYYVPQLAELAKGLIPYRDFPYSFTPLFLYVLYPFYVLGGPSAASIPITLADAATAVAIYKVVQLWSVGKTPILAGLAYCVLPFAVVYEGYLWLSSQPMTFFMVLSVYLASRDRYLGSATFLGVASMFKQEALFILPGFFLFTASKLKRRVLKVLAVLAGVVFVVSLPFLLTAPNQYIVSVSYGLVYFGIPVTYPTGAINGSALPSTSSSLASPICSTISLSLVGSHLGCGYGYVFYPNPLLTDVLLFLNGLGQLVLIPLLVLLGIALYAAREHTSFLEASSIYSIIILLSVFAYTINPLLRYYLIPAYALLLASSRNKRGIVVGVVFSTASLVTSTGTFQVVLVALATLLILSLDTQGTLGQRSAVTKRSRHPSEDATSITWASYVNDPAKTTCAPLDVTTKPLYC